MWVGSHQGRRDSIGEIPGVSSWPNDQLLPQASWAARKGSGRGVNYSLGVDLIPGYLIILAFSRLADRWKTSRTCLWVMVFDRNACSITNPRSLSYDYFITDMFDAWDGKKAQVIHRQEAAGCV